MNDLLVNFVANNRIGPKLVDEWIGGNKKANENE